MVCAVNAGDLDLHALIGPLRNDSGRFELVTVVTL